MKIIFKKETEVLKVVWKNDIRYLLATADIYIYKGDKDKLAVLADKKYSQFICDLPISQHAEKHFHRPIIENDDWVADKNISYWKWTDNIDEGKRFVSKIVRSYPKLIKSFIINPESNIFDLTIRSDEFVGYTCIKGSDVFRKVNWIKIVIQQLENGYLSIKTIYPVETP